MSNELNRVDIDIKDTSLVIARDENGAYCMADEVLALLAEKDKQIANARREALTEAARTVIGYPITYSGDVNLAHDIARGERLAEAILQLLSVP